MTARTKLQQFGPRLIVAQISAYQHANMCSAIATWMQTHPSSRSSVPEAQGFSLLPAALLERLVAASGQQGGASEAPQSLRGQGTGSFLGGSERGGSGRYNTRRGAQFSPDKAQLMLLANAADASGGRPLQQMCSLHYSTC